MSIDIDYIKGIIEHNDGILLSTWYKNAHAKLEIQCNKDGYKWLISWNNIKSGKWCPKCANRPKITLDIVRQLIESKGGILLSGDYKNSKSKFKIKCLKDNYIWEARWNNLQQHQWCPKCAKNFRLDITEIKNFIELKNGILLSNKYINSENKLKIMCNDCMHIWEIKWSNIKSGRWCPKCNSGKHQKKLYNIIKSIFYKYNIKYNYKEFDWLATYKNGKQELDIYVPELKLAIEYDGEQHFKPVRFGGISTEQAENNFKRVKQLDKLKNKKIKQHSKEIKYFIRFNYKEPLNKEYITKKLSAIGVIL